MVTKAAPPPSVLCFTTWMTLALTLFSEPSGAVYATSSTLDLSQSCQNGT